MTRLARHADLLLALVLFTGLSALSWRRWASFSGDLSREWTTPARVASGERLYRDVAYYYGPLAPWLEGATMRVLGARVGTVIALDLVTAAGTLALILLASRAFLPLAGRLALASVAVGVFAFAPENGALVACYSQSALLAVALSWLAFLLASRGRAGGAGVASGLALLSKLESAPAVLAAFLLPRRRALLATLAIGLAIAGYAFAVRGLTREELVHYGPLRHLQLPPEFRELYLRVSGLHPRMVPGAVTGVLTGAALALGWLLAVPALAGLAGRERGPRDGARAIAGLSLLGSGIGLFAVRPEEPLLTTLTRGLPLVLAIALVDAALRARHASDEEERIAAARAAAAAVLGFGFLWRTLLWTVPSLPYAPLAAISALPAACFLFSRARRARLLVLAPLLAAPLFALPRLVLFYRSPRTCVEAPQGTWCPPGEEGELFAKLVEHLEKAGVKDRSLVVVPEASALGFLLGVRSPLRLEQLLPGHLDERADVDAVLRMQETRPERVVVLERATTELGGGVLGRDYGRGLAALIKRDYRVETRIEAGAKTALVLVRRDLTDRAPGAGTRS